MDYISARDAASQWGISQRRVAVLCAEGRIPNAERIGNMWLIPKNCDKPSDGRADRYSKDKKLKPILKWAGGKGQIIDELRKYYPPELGVSIKKYAEPFVGGGAVLFDILSNYDIDEVYISDINRELINTYCQIRDNVDKLIDILSIYASEYIPLNEIERKQYYYKKRNRFNELKASSLEGVELAALFIFINRTCFNGLYRVNRNGAYNVPMGAYKKPLICDEENIRRVSDALSHVTIVCGDYRLSNEFIDNKTFVYFDPPYRPLDETSNFTSYNESKFTDEDQRILAEYIKEVATRGAYVVASNSDPKNANPEDNFFDDLYCSMTIERIYASRMINSKASARGKISELVIHSSQEGRPAYD